MHSRRDSGRRPYRHQVVVGLAVVASTVAACLAAFVGRLDGSRVTLFGLSGLLAAVVALLTSPEKKYLTHSASKSNS